MQNAFISIEDQRFEDHFGIDIKRIIILEDSIIFSLDVLKQVYISQATWDNNNKLTHVLGVSVDQLSSSNSIVEDYPYQIPTKTCTYHTKWHYEQWITQKNFTNDNKIDSNLKDTISDIVDELIDNDNTDNSSNKPTDSNLEFIREN